MSKSAITQHVYCVIEELLEIKIEFLIKFRLKDRSRDDR